MIIVSQDKKEIINFDNLVSVYVIESYEAKEKGLEKYNIDFATTDEINFVIGTYETKERAKEVLQEIINKYKEYATIQNGAGSISNVKILPKVYEMPER